MEKRTAEYFAKQQREISISEFFEKNRHLLGFDNPTKALLIATKEAVDNSLDATMEARILPEIKVKIKQVNDFYRIIVEDNGPGIVKKQIPNIFGKLLYGSKFHRLRQSIGQQGIGISAVVLYSQLTTGNPVKVYSKIENKDKTHVFHIRINTAKNEPEIVYEEDISEGKLAIKEHGVRVEMDILGRYRRSRGVDDYLTQVSIANPFAKIIYHAPDGRKITFSRAVDRLPKEPKEIKPHPYGVELGILLRMLGSTKSKTLSAFLQNEFSSIGSKTAKKVLKIARLKENENPRNLERRDAEKLLKTMQKTKIQRPPLDVLSPIGKEELEKGLRKKYPDAEFIFTETRSPNVYRGIPFQVEAGIVYGGDLPKDKQVEVIRFANRIPLLFQASAGAIYEAITSMNWRRYGLQQSAKSLPVGPCVIVAHLCSAWVPFISESKEAIAPYPEIVKEIKLGLQDCARSLLMHIRRKQRKQQETKRLHIFEDYLPLIAESAADLAETEKPKIDKILKKVVREKYLGEDSGK